jgi:hypothetical protein
MKDMESVNTREIQQHTKAVRERLLAGESLEWVMGKKVVGYLTPAGPLAEPAAWPDLNARLKAIYHRQASQEEPGARAIYDDRR